jgi:conjugal transfer pilus assembly protein TraW
MDKEKYILEAKNKARSFILNYKPSDLTRKLPAAKENNVFLVDLTYTLQFDIPDGKGGILYPKGYTFNPLEYAPLFIKTIVIIDGDRREQVDWFKASPLMKKIDVTLMLSGGAYHKVMKELKRPVFYASQRIIDRLGIKATPSVAVQQGKYFQIHEYLVTAEDTK